jgi:hypothetical protein
MAHIKSIGAALYSRLDYSSQVHAPGDFTASTPAADLAAFFTTVDPVTTPATATLARTIGDVRSFPAMGTPANIVKVPVYGQATSQSIQGQADAPQLEIDINYVAADWGSTTANAIALKNKDQRLFRFTLLNAEPADDTLVAIKAVENSSFYWVGKMEAMVITPSLTDATTAKLTLSIQSPFYGAYTADA